MARANAQVERRDHISCIDFQSDHQMNPQYIMDPGMFIKKYVQKEQVFSRPFPLGLISIFIVSGGFVGYDKLCHKQPM